MRLLLDITAHGLGHLAQCAPVIAALRATGPLALIVRSGLPPERLHDRLGAIEQIIPADTDFGAVMCNGLDVDYPATLARYRAVLSRLPQEVQILADTLRRTGCDVVLSDISFIACEAAAVAGVPCVLFSSLTWHEVLQFCGPQADDAVQAMLAAYRKADRILRLMPGTAFDGLDSTPVSRPIARIGRARRAELAVHLGDDPARPTALLAFGGMLPPTPPPLAADPAGFRVIGPAAWHDAGVVPVESIGLPFEDLLRSVDVVVSKPGYGIVTELACCGTASVMLPRPDWPELPALTDWMAARARCLTVPGLWDLNADALRDCLALPRPRLPRPLPGGEHEIAAAVRTVSP